MNVKNTYFCFILVEYRSFHHGEPSIFWGQNTKLHELVEKVITDEFLNTGVAATNAHSDDPPYHHLQNILNSVNYLRNKSRELWSHQDWK